MRDSALIAEVENFKPFLENGTSGWKAVAVAINEKLFCNVDHIGVKRRFLLLLKDFKKEDFMARYKYEVFHFPFKFFLPSFSSFLVKLILIFHEFNVYRSGTEEEITEIKTKLQNLALLIEEQKLEEKAEAEAKTKSLNEQKLAGEQVRGAAMEGLKRSRKIIVLQY